MINEQYDTAMNQWQRINDELELDKETRRKPSGRVGAKMAICKTPSGKWAADYRDAAGVRHAPVFGKRSDAAAFLAETLTAVKTENFVLPPKFTLGEIADRWLEGKKLGRRESTYDAYENHIENWIKPTFGSVTMADLSVELIEKKMRDWNKTISAKHCGKILTTLTAIGKLAVKYRYVRVNVAMLAEAPRRVHDIDEREGNSVSPDEVLSAPDVKKLIYACKPGLGRALIMTACLTGMRHGELIALQWSAVDLKAGKISVRRSTTDSKKFNAPKTKAGRRLIDMPAELVSELKRWKLQAPVSADDLVFCQDDGTALHRKTNAATLLWPAIDEAKVKKITMHGLRHSFASILLANGVKAPEVSYILGHDKVITTMSIYAHWCRDVVTDTGKRLGSVVFGTGK
jgi:integrase